MWFNPIKNADGDLSICAKSPHLFEQFGHPTYPLPYCVGCFLGPWSQELCHKKGNVSLCNCWIDKLTSRTSYKKLNIVSHMILMGALHTSNKWLARHSVYCKAFFAMITLKVNHMDTAVLRDWSAEPHNWQEWPSSCSTILGTNSICKHLGLGHVAGETPELVKSIERSHK